MAETPTSKYASRMSQAAAVEAVGTALGEKRRLVLKEPRADAAEDCHDTMCCSTLAWLVPVKSTYSLAELPVVCAVLHAACELKKLKALASSCVCALAAAIGTRVAAYFSRASVFWHQNDDSTGKQLKGV